MKSPIEGWTDAKFKGFIVSALRNAFRRYPPKQECIDKAFTKVKLNPASKRKAKHYRCAKCKGEFPRTAVEADHIKPIVDPKVGFTNFDTWIKRAFVGFKGFQCLCKTCHTAKTSLERKLRNAK